MEQSKLSTDARILILEGEVKKLQEQIEGLRDITGLVAEEKGYLHLSCPSDGAY